MQSPNKRKQTHFMLLVVIGYDAMIEWVKSVMANEWIVKMKPDINHVFS